MSIIFNLIKQNWIGSLIGIGVAIILSLILGFTALKNNKKLSVIVSLTLMISCLFTGIFIQSYYFKGSNPEKNPDIYDETIENLNADKYTHITSDSGFDRTYVEKNRPLAEICEDKFADLKMVEYKDVVIFSYDYVYDNVNYCVNIIMYKAQNSLVFDGCFNIKLKYTCEATIFNVKPEPYFNPTSTELNSTQYPVIFSEMWRGDNFTNKNFESQTDNGYRYPFWKNPVLPRWYRITKPSEINALCGHDIWSAGTTSTGKRTFNIFKKSAEQFCYRLRETLFQQIGELTIMLNKDAASNSMDTVYNDIFNAVKGNTTGKYILDVTNHFYYYEAVKKEDKNEYVLYNNKCILNLNYTNKSDKNCFKTGKDYVNAVDKANSHVPADSRDVEQVKTITFKLNNKYNRNLSGYDPKSAPVKIKLTNSNNAQKTYIYLFDTIEKINSQIMCGIAPGNYDVEIESDVLDIGNIGSLKVDKSKTVNINFDYQAGTVLVSVELNPLSNFDFSTINFTENPVIITFNNGKSSYNFTFNTLAKLNNPITKRIPIGNYTYSIKSNELAFKDKNGEISVNVNNNQFIFNYDYKTNIEYGLKLTNATMNQYMADEITIAIIENITDYENISNSQLLITHQPYGSVNPGTMKVIEHSEISKQQFIISRNDVMTNGQDYIIQLKLTLNDGSVIMTNTTRITFINSIKSNDGTKYLNYMEFTVSAL